MNYACTPADADLNESWHWLLDNQQHPSPTQWMAGWWIITSGSGPLYQSPTSMAAAGYTYVGVCLQPNEITTLQDQLAAANAEITKLEADDTKGAS